jgi:ABC-type branched-subunit amino acid transport system permease subunit
MKLNVRALSVTLGVFFGLGLFTFTWWVILRQGATGEPTLIGKLYPGYSISAVGSFVGLAWATLDGLITGALFALLYNYLATRFTASPAA